MKRFLKRTTALIVAVAMSAVLTPELDTFMGDKVWAEESSIDSSDIGLENDNEINSTATIADEISPLSNEIVASGQCGDNAYWKLTGDGTLTISGTGSIYSYSNIIDIGGGDHTTAPWWTYRKQILSIVVESGITKITDYAFHLLSYTESITFADGISTIGGYTFCCDRSLTKVVIPKSVTSIGPIKCVCGTQYSQLTFYGYKGSYAETYAKKNNITFVVLDDMDNEDDEQDDKASGTDTAKIDYINQHFWAALPRYWNEYHEVQDTKEYYDDNWNTELGHSAAMGIDFACDLVTFNKDGVIEHISANAYNAILMDMFLEVQNKQSAEDFYLFELEKNTKKTMKPLLDMLSGVSKNGNNYYKIFGENEDFAKELYSAAQLNSSKNVFDVFEKHGYMDDISTNELIEISADAVMNGALGDLGKVTKGINNGFEFVEFFKEIINAETLVSMDEEYRNILYDILDEAENYDGNSWEISDLKNAIKYEIGYRQNFVENITWESFKMADNITGFTDDIVNKVWKPFVKDYITNTFGESFYAEFAAVQAAVKIGSYASNQMFNLNKATDLYFEGKAYGVLEDILREILDEKSANLKYCDDSESFTSDEIQTMYTNAKLFDYAFRMYTFVEANGCEVYSNYEKAFLVDDENWYNALWEYFGKGFELVVRWHWGDFGAFSDMVEVHMQRNYNVLWYQRRSNFIKENIICHGKEFDTKDGALKYAKKVSENYLKMLETDMKMAEVMCPVEVEVYDENDNYIGSISDNQNTITNDLNIYAYRNESANANIIVCPSNYTLMIKGLDDGEMTILSGYSSGSVIENAVAYVRIPVTDGYVAKLDITSDSDSLNDNRENTTTPDTSDTPDTDNIPDTSLNQSTSSNGNNTNTDTDEDSNGEDISAAAAAYGVIEQIGNSTYAWSMIIVSVIGVTVIIIKKRNKVHK